MAATGLAEVGNSRLTGLTSDAGFGIGMPVTFMALLLHGRPRETQRHNAVPGQMRVAVQHIRRRFPREARKLPTLIVPTRAETLDQGCRGARISP